MKHNIARASLNFTRRMMLLGCAAVAALGVMALSPAAAEYPEKPIKLLVPFPPGGAPDTIARVMAPRLQEILGQPVIVDNRVGANGAIALKELAEANPDGHTLVITTASPLVTNPHTFENLAYDPLQDFAYIGTVSETESLLVVSPNVKANTLDELVAESKVKGLRFGISGQGGQPHILIEKIKHDTGADITTVPYTGSAAVNDVVAGHVDGTVFDMPQLMSLVRENRLKAIAVLSRKSKSDFLPEVPSIGDVPEYSGFISRSWTMLLTTAGTPDEVVGKLHAAVDTAVKEEATIAALRKVAMTPMLSNSPQEANEFIQSEYEHFREIVAETGVRIKN